MEFLARVTGRCHAVTTYRPILAHARPNVTLHSVPKSLTLPASLSHFFWYHFNPFKWTVALIIFYLPSMLTSNAFGYFFLFLSFNFTFCHKVICERHDFLPHNVPRNRMLIDSLFLPELPGAFLGVIRSKSRTTNAAQQYALKKCDRSIDRYD